MDDKFVERLAGLIGGRSKAQFAKDCGIKSTTMLGYLSGSSQPNLPAIRKIAEANNVSCGWLLGEDFEKESCKEIESRVAGRDEKLIGRILSLKGGRSDTAAARAWGLPRTTLINILSGNSDPKISTVRQIAEANNVTVGWLAGDDIHETPPEDMNDSIVPSPDEEKLLRGIRQFGGLPIKRFMEDLELFRLIVRGK